MKYIDFLDTVSGCPFCEDGTQEKILENETAYLTYSIAPYHPDHLLIVPRKHVEHLLDLSTNEIKDIEALQKNALEILSKLGYSNISIMVRDGARTGKSVSHLHYHVIPDIVLGDRDHAGKDRQVLDGGQIESLVQKLKSVI